MKEGRWKTEQQDGRLKREDGSSETKGGRKITEKEDVMKEGRWKTGQQDGRLKKEEGNCRIEERRWKTEDGREQMEGSCVPGNGANLNRRWTSMLRRLKQSLLLLVSAFVVATVCATAGYADNPQSAYITIRCTATISIELFNRAAGGGLLEKTSYYNFGDVAAASTATAVNPIGVRNNSQGAITQWELDVLEDGGYIDQGAAYQWTLGSAPGINKAAMFVKFSSTTLTNDDFDMAVDSLTTTTQGAKTYSMTNFYSYCSQYLDSEYAGGANLVLPTSYDAGAEGKAERRLWIKMLTPTAVNGANQDVSILLRLTAK
ncbi:MAG: hypothetical protein ABII64_08465 [Elusimicrobiota bacterium]